VNVLYSDPAFYTRLLFYYAANSPSMPVFRHALRHMRLYLPLTGAALLLRVSIKYVYYIENSSKDKSRLGKN